ncbi:hypothetical protein [Pseudoxanthomonas spadix]|nr:hypothetical protein [Pseudoxanthomonas spadix]
MPPAPVVRFGPYKPFDDPADTGKLTVGENLLTWPAPAAIAR